MNTDRNKPVAGSFYRHFKGNLYQIKMLARDSETNQEMVVYQGMYAPFATWVRPLDMFMEKLDKEKYPQTKQQYRFELASPKEENQASQEESAQAAPFRDEKETLPEPVSEEEIKKAFLSGRPDKYLSDKMTEQEIAHQGYMALLDANGCHEKRQIFIGLKQYLNERLLHNIAVAVGIVLEDGSQEEHYETILRYLETVEKYEGGRLRR